MINNLNAQLKRIISLLTPLLAVLLLTGCGAAEKTEAPAENLSPAVYPELVFSELMPKNTAAVRDIDGEYRDWVELYNPGSETAELSGWSVSDGKNSLQLPEGTFIAPYGYLCVFCRNFSLSKNETLRLVRPDRLIADEITCPELKNNISYALGMDGQWQQTKWYSPGYENSDYGYYMYTTSVVPSGPVIINEVCTAQNDVVSKRSDTYYDWVELKNISERTVKLSDYYLSDDKNERQRLPETILGPGELAVVCCNKSEGDVRFGLDSNNDSVFLRSSDGRIADALALTDMPLNGSIGRLDDLNGLFYFNEMSPGEDNEYGLYFVAGEAKASVEPGVFDGSEGLSIELSGDGRIYYTLDASVPTEASALYTEPINIEYSTVLRTLCVKDGALPSRVSTFSYIFNTEHELPIVSLVIDSWPDYTDMIVSQNKDVELSANMSYFDGENRFMADCGLELKGKTSLSLPKKSYCVYFRDRYGDGDIKCDIFGNGVTGFGSLSIRAGQDYTFSYVRNELCQETALKYAPSLLTQSSRYCAVYINGWYLGMYCLKENINEQFYASHTGVSEESVEMLNFPAGLSSDFYQEIYKPAMQMDLDKEEKYRAVADKLDIDAFIDWVIFEGWCGNTDTAGNVKFFRSTENGNKWTPVFYDLDWAFFYQGSQFTAISGERGNGGGEMPWLIHSLMTNEEFKNKLVSRFAELCQNSLTEENMLSELDRLVSTIDNEVKLDRVVWSLRYESWQGEVEHLRQIIEYDWMETCLSNFKYYMYVDSETLAKYFPHIA